MSKLTDRFTSKPAIAIYVALFLVVAFNINPNFIFSPLDQFGQNRTMMGGEGDVVSSLPTPTYHVERGKLEPLDQQAGMGASRSMLAQPVEDSMIGLPPYYGGEDFDSPIRYEVKTGNLDLKAKNVNQAMTDAANYVDSVNGLTSNSSLSKSDNRYYGYMSVRVPVSEFNAAMQYFKSLGSEVVGENIYTYDETNQVTNTEDRQAALADQIIEYEALLQQTTDSTERLKIQRQLDSIRNQQQALEKQLENLKGQADMSQINLSFEEERFSLPFFEDIGLSHIFREASQALVKVGAFIIVLIIWVVVFTPIWLPALLFFKWRKNRIAKK